MTPETWLPTCTVVTAESVPVAVTVMVMSPRSTFSTRYCWSFLPPPRQASETIKTTAIAERRNLKKTPPVYDNVTQTLKAPKFNGRITQQQQSNRQHLLFFLADGALHERNSRRRSSTAAA